MGDGELKALPLIVEEDIGKEGSLHSSSVSQIQTVTCSGISQLARLLISQKARKYIS